MAEELLAEPNQPLFPPANTPNTAHLRPRLSPLRSPLPGATAPAHEHNEEDERASECHEQDLPPLKRVSTALLDDSRLIDTRNCWERSGALSAGWSGRDFDELGKTGAESWDNGAIVRAFRRNAFASSEDLVRACAREASTRASTGAATAA